MKNIKKYILLCIVILLIIIGVIFVILNNNGNTKTNEENNVVSKINILEVLQEEKVIIENFLIYGTHLNISGFLDNIQNYNIKEIKIVFSNSLNEEKEYETSYELKNNKIYFKTSEYINKGINLEKIDVEKYGIFLKVIFNDGNAKYYTFDKENFEEIEYYTISRNKKCNKLVFNYDGDKICISLDGENVDMPEDIFDISIDAGHGGNDPGATYNGYNESDITLDYSKTLKEELEKQGLKVKLTRIDDTRVKEYGENGRAVIPNKVKSKYTFSIHLNSSEKSKYNGIEVYAPSKSDLTFAKLLADNIVKYSNTNYSNNQVCKTLEGVYVRTMSDEDIVDSEKIAKALRYKPYNITTDTPYLFMIRETGGKSTNAYIDGRNVNYEKNIYANSNIGNESYLIELGFINSKKDLDNLLNNKEGYIKGIVESIMDIVK